MRRQDPLEIGGYRQFFVDDYLIDRVQNLRLNVHSWEKHPQNPVLRSDKPWEGNGKYALNRGSVLKDPEENKLRMWYWSSGGDSGEGEMMNYAVSSDGIRWEKPNLGIHTFQGSRDNNIVMISNPVENNMETYGVIHCPWDEDKERRYKAVFWEKVSEEMRGVWTAVSPDGLHWRKSTAPLARYAGDTVGFFYDAFRQKYVAFVKIHTGRGRSRAMAESDDFREWTAPELILKTDDRDIQPCDLYNNTGFIWESLYLGYLQVYYHHQHPYQSKLVLELIYSRDGVNWKRMPNRETVLDVGPDGAWDRTNQEHMNGAPVLIDGTMYFYYGGRTYFHPPYRHGETRCNIGLATMRRDGFVSRDASPIEGSLETKALLFHGSRLHVNVKSDWGYCKVELLDESGAPIEGFTANECQPLRTDSIDGEARFLGKANIGSRTGKPTKLKFYLQNARLYSFWVE